MRHISWLWALCLLALLGGCESATKRARAGATITAEPASSTEQWQAVASPADKTHLGRIGIAWQTALAAAQPKYRREIASEGDLLKPLAAQARPQPTPGSYNCRLVMLGATAKKTPAFQKFKPFFCYVQVDESGLLTIVKQTGSQRPAGQLWDDDDPTRMIFLGSLALGDEKEPLGYGDDPSRDMAGIFERIAPFQWRLVIPWPSSGGILQVFELTPVANQPT